MQVRLLLLFASLLKKSFKTFLYRKRYSFEIRELILLKSKENELKELGANSLYFRGELTLLQGRTHKGGRGKLAVWRNLHRSFLHQEISWAGYAVESYMNFCDQLFDCSLSSIIFTCSI